MEKSKLLDILISKLNKFDDEYNTNIDVLKTLDGGNTYIYTLELREQKTVNTCKTLMEIGFNISYDYPTDNYNIYELCLEYVVMNSICIKDNKANFNTETIIFEFKNPFGSDEPLQEAIQAYNKILKTYKFVDNTGKIIKY